MLALQAAECTADEGFGGGGGVLVEDRADGLAGIDLLVAERDEGEFGIGGLRGNLAGGGVLPSVGDADLVLELEDDALGGFFADPFGFGKERDIARHDGGLEHRHRHPAEDRDGDGGADAGYAVDEQQENVALLLGGESVERLGIFPDVEMGAEINGRALCRVKPVVGGNGDDRLVAHTMAVHDEPVRKGLDDVSSESSDHR